MNQLPTCPHCGEPFCPDCGEHYPGQVGAIRSAKLGVPRAQNPTPVMIGWDSNAGNNSTYAQTYASRMQQYVGHATSQSLVFDAALKARWANPVALLTEWYYIPAQPGTIKLDYVKNPATVPPATDTIFWGWVCESVSGGVVSGPEDGQVGAVTSGLYRPSASMQTVQWNSLRPTGGSETYLHWWAVRMQAYLGDVAGPNQGIPDMSYITTRLESKWQTPVAVLSEWNARLSTYGRGMKKYSASPPAPPPSTDRTFWEWVWYRLYLGDAQSAMGTLGDPSGEPGQVGALASNVQRQAQGSKLSQAVRQTGSLPLWVQRTTAGKSYPVAVPAGPTRIISTCVGMQWTVAQHWASIAFPGSPAGQGNVSLDEGAQMIMNRWASPADAVDQSPLKSGPYDATTVDGAMQPLRDSLFTPWLFKQFNNV